MQNGQHYVVDTSTYAMRCWTLRNALLDPAQSVVVLASLFAYARLQEMEPNGIRVLAIFYSKL